MNGLKIEYDVLLNAKIEYVVLFAVWNDVLRAEKTCQSAWFDVVVVALRDCMSICNQ